MKTITFLAIAMLAGTLFAGTGGGGYTLMDAGSVVQQTAGACSVQTTQTLTIVEPRIRYEPKVEYVERQIQIPTVQVMTSSAPCVPCVPSQAQAVGTYQLQTIPMTTSTCVGGQCVQQQCVGGQCVNPAMLGSNYVPDSDIGTNIRYEPAVITTEDGFQRQIRTPIRAAMTMLRVQRQPADPDPVNANFR